ncbi:MAG TPA: hypothetical protein VN777_02130 [Terriglobales bacterium]|nr:hypothetical protein [Terriglobales bacterium]
MIHRERFRQTTRPLLLVLLILMVASTAFDDRKEKVLYSFQGGSDGQSPAGVVVFDKAGNLYGATYERGSPPLRRDVARSSSSVRELAAVD